MLHRFGFFSYLYCAFSATFFVSIIIREGFNFDSADFWFPILFITHPIAQFIYTTQTRPFMHLRDWKETNSLDDFLTNDVDMESKMAENSGLMKTLAVLGVVGMGLVVFIGTINLDRIVTHLFSGLDEMVSNISALLSIPTGILGIIYNVRTFAMKKILEKV